MIQYGLCGLTVTVISCVVCYLTGHAKQKCHRGSLTFNCSKENIPQGTWLRVWSLIEFLAFGCSGREGISGNAASAVPDGGGVRRGGGAGVGGGGGDDEPCVPLDRVSVHRTRRAAHLHAERAAHLGTQLHIRTDRPQCEHKCNTGRG